MSALIIALILIVAGVAGLVYGKISYTETSHEAKIGPFDLSLAPSR